VKPIGELLINIAEIATSCGGVRRHQLIIRPADLLVKGQIGRAAQTAALGVLMKDAGKEERVIADMGTKQKRLLGGSASKSDQHIGNILALMVARQVRRAHSAGPGKGLQERRDVITQFPVRNSNVPQNVAGEDVKIKMG
jgi:hypothetical protein